MEEEDTNQPSCFCLIHLLDLLREIVATAAGRSKQKLVLRLVGLSLKKYP